MAYKVIRNRIPELIQALKDTDDKNRRSRVLTEKAQTAANVLLADMTRRAPVGRVEPNYSVRRKDGTFLTISHGRPSLRQHGMTLAQGWLSPTFEATSKGVNFKILSQAPHMQILLDGATDHRIPRAGNALLSFWHFKSGDRFKAAIAAYVNNHPGFAKKTFVEDSAKVKRAFTLAKFREAVAGVLLPLRMFFNK